MCLSLLETQDSTTAGQCALLCGQLAQAQGAWEKALEHYQTALPLLGNDRTALAKTSLHLAEAWEATGQFARAMEVLKTAFQEE